MIPLLHIAITVSHSVLLIQLYHNNNNNNRFTALCQGLPGWAGTRRNTHPPSWSSSNLHQLLPSTTIHSILLVQFTCLAIFLYNLFPCPLWSTSWSGALHLIFHTFLHPITSFFCSTYPYHRNLYCCSINIISSIPSLSLNSLLGTFILTLHVHLTILICARWSATLQLYHYYNFITNTTFGFCLTILHFQS